MVRGLPLLLIVVLGLAACGGTGGKVATEGGHVITGDAPAIRVHTDQRDIDAGRLGLVELIQRGRALMSASFNALDGVGQPAATAAPGSRGGLPDNVSRVSSLGAGSCVSCHSLPRFGGGGDSVGNIFLLAQRAASSRSEQQLGGTTQLPPLDVLRERNAVGMFGSGFIELLAREMTADLQGIREGAISESIRTGRPVRAELVTKGVSFGWVLALPDGSVDTGGVEGVDEDLVIKPFDQKGVVVSLREFTVDALARHHGMQAAERFGDGADPDGDGVVDEVTPGDVTAITIFQATLPVPGVVLPADPEARAAVERGRELFVRIGCGVCHVPQLPLSDPVFTEPSPYNPAGNLQMSQVARPFAVDLTGRETRPRLARGRDGVVMVPAFTDLKRHEMGEVLDNEGVVQGGVPTGEWLTRKLWGMYSEPPFLHHGRATLVSDAVLAHGGEAQEPRDAFAALSEGERAALVEFLKTLQVLPEGAGTLEITAGGG